MALARLDPYFCVRRKWIKSSLDNSIWLLPNELVACRQAETHVPRYRPLQTARAIPGSAPSAQLFLEQAAGFSAGDVRAGHDIDPLLFDLNG